MSDLLFVNACVRPRGVSRTQSLADAFLEEYRAAYPQDSVEELCLAKLAPPPVLGELFARREQLKAQKAADAPEFEEARRFAAAKRILVAAPMWELSFPAVLKTYIETISVPGITFGYGDNPTGCVGLCGAQKLWFLTTRGGEYPEEYGEIMELGTREIKALCRFFGIKVYGQVCAEGLDMVSPQECEERMEHAKAQARRAARELL